MNEIKTPTQEQLQDWIKALTSTESIDKKNEEKKCTL